MSVNKLLVLEALTKLGVQGPLLPRAGICANLDRVLIGQFGVGCNSKYDSQTFLTSYIRRWPESSGNLAYPVEGNPEIYGKRGMWSLDTEVGRKRYRLLAWLIHEITKEIRNECA